MITRAYLEDLFEELLDQAEQIQIGTVEDERLDAQLCLIEEMLEQCQGEC